jgi:NAD(P)-dependent dehydrogenase (short-subunit alcohol dehydrogenase family)
MTDKNLAGKVAIVTGGGGGMGRAITLALIERGARVAVFDVSRTKTDAVVTEAAATGDSECAIPVTRDVTSADDCEAAIRETIDAFNSVDILVNAAGIGMQTIKDGYWNDPVKFWEIDYHRFSNMMHINWHGAFLMAAAAAPHMIERGWGRIINVTTSLDTMCTRGYTPYGPSKAALEAGTSIWAKDLEGTGVTANVVVPGGPVNTGFIPANAPFDRATLIQPEVMTAPICWLATDDADGVTDCRFVSRLWDASLPAEQAVRAAGAPCAWVAGDAGAFRPYRDK